MTKPTAIVTAGPTIEQIDPVRFISNYSSGKQGYYIAEALLKAGFAVTLVSGPVNLKVSSEINLIKVKTADEMLKACIKKLPSDVAICVAAVCDYRPEKTSKEKLKKTKNQLTLKLVKNPDILQTISHHKKRPKIVVGFAAETEKLITNAKKKLVAKNLDMIVANNVKKTNIFGEEITSASIIKKTRLKKTELLSFDNIKKQRLAEIIVKEILSSLNFYKE